MKKFLFLLFLSSNAFAALSPYYQGIKEINSILEAKDLEESLKGYGIVEIKKNETGFLISSKDRSVQVDVNYKAVNRPGPQKFDIYFHPSVEIINGRN